MSDDARTVALVCLPGDPRLGERLRAAAWRGVTPTVFAHRDDVRVRRLARAAGAELGSIWPDATGTAVFVTDGHAPTGAALAGLAVVTDHTTPWPDARRVWRLVDGAPTASSDGLAITDWDGATLTALSERGWRFSAAGEGTPAPERLDGLRVLHVTSVHRPDDGRIFHKEVQALRAAGADASVLGFDPRPSRTRRLPAGWRLMAEARRRRPDVVHIHDPELLPAAAMLRRTSPIKVIYDVHEYLGQTTRTKPWIPGPLRLPAAVVVEQMERMLAGQVDAVVAVTEDMALAFAEAGIDAVTVANFAPRDRFPEAPLPDAPVVVYVGALDRSRGRALMLAAFPMIDVPGARLILAGPGDPGPLPPAITHIGPVAYDEVPGVLAGGRVAWIPLRRTPNNDRGRLTKVMEAMAAGRALVTSDLTRTAAIVHQAGCGLVAPFDDPAAHAAAIRTLLRDPARTAAMGAAGRAAFLASMTFEREAATLVALYARLTGRDRNGAS